MELPTYEQAQYNTYINTVNFDLEDFYTNVRYNRNNLLNYITVSDFTAFPHNSDKVLVYDYGKLLNINLKKYPTLFKYVLNAMVEDISESWNEMIDTYGRIYYQHKYLSETIRCHPMNVYYSNLIREKKKRIQKRKNSCSIM